MTKEENRFTKFRVQPAEIFAGFFEKPERQRFFFFCGLFFLNRSFVFTDKGKVSQAFLRYLGVFFLVMLLSALLTSSLHLWLGWSDNTAKIPVDIVLFFVSYHLQRRWVFQKKPAKAG